MLLKFKEGSLKILLSSSILDEGIDIERIDTLVLASARKSRRQILQRIGRGLRRKRGENVVDIIDFFDLDGKYLEKHSRERLKLYKKEKFDIIIESFDGKVVEQYKEGRMALEKRENEI